MKLSLISIFEAMTGHAVNDRLASRMDLSPMEKEKVKIQIEKDLVNFNRNVLFKLPKHFWTDHYLPPTIWKRIQTPDGQKQGIAIMAIRSQLNVVTILSLDMVDPATGTPINKHSKTPARGMSFKQFEKYLSYLLNDKSPRKFGWESFKNGVR